MSQTWKVTPLAAPAAPCYRPSRGEPTAYQRCLAVHMHFAQNPGALASSESKARRLLWPGVLGAACVAYWFARQLGVPLP